MSNRASALEHLKAAASTLTLDFFSLKGNLETRTWPYSAQGTAVTLTVTKRQYSHAKPKHISYEIKLGSLLAGESLVIYVEDPIRDEVEGGLEANRAAYKRCLEKLVENPQSFTATKKAVVPPSS